MGSAGFTLAERLGAKSLPCSVPGCTRTWISLAGAGKGLKLAGRSAPDPADPSSGMCDPCREKFANLRDVERPCARPGCAGTRPWSIAAQLAAFATKQPPPTALCAGCEEKLAALEDKPIPCSVAGCTRSSVYTRRAQLLAGAPDADTVPEGVMCGPCDGVFKKLKNRQVSCGINGCKHKWLWTADEQIVAYATGKPNDPPRRMCDECKTVYGAIADREVRCRTSGCKKTWTWSRGDQLDACLAGKPVPKAPARMCPSCLDIYSRVKDVERPCRRSTCKRTWTDKRGAQLARAVRGKTGDPYPHYCAECEKELGELEDRQVPCKTDHCTGTWTWTSAQQLAAGVRPVVKNLQPDGPDAREQAGNGKDHGQQPHGRQNARQQALAAPAAPAPDAEPGTPAGVSNGAHAAGDVEEHVEAEASGVESAAAAQEPEDRGHADSAEDQDEHHDGDQDEHHDGHAHPGGHAQTLQVQSGGPIVAAPGSGRKGRNRNRKRRREPRPPERRCEACIEFLKDRKTHEIPCSRCTTPIYWPPESQLQTHLGNWSEPSLCGACKRDATEAARAAQREALRHPPMPGVSAATEAPAPEASSEAPDAAPPPVAAEAQEPAPEATS